MLMVGAMLMALATPVYAMEEEKVVYSEETAQTRSSLTPVTANKEDREGNVFYIYGYSEAIGSRAVVQTSYRVVFYADGKEDANDPVNNLKKTLKSESRVTYGTVSFNGSEELNKENTQLTGKSNSITVNRTYDYTVKSITTTHTFSCNGASWNGTSYN